EVGRARCRGVLQLVALGGGAPVLGRLEGVDGGQPEAAEDRGVTDGPGCWHVAASWTTGIDGAAALPCLVRLQHRPAPAGVRTGWGGRTLLRGAACGSAEGSLGALG